VSAVAENFDPARATVGVFVGLAGLLFLAEPFVSPVAIGGFRIRAVALSGVALAVGLDLGAVVFYRRGQSTVAMGHGVAGLGWTVLAVGPLLGGEAVLLVGVLVVVAGAVFLVTESRKWP
jgi:hypothetical protein